MKTSETEKLVILRIYFYFWEVIKLFVDLPIYILINKAGVRHHLSGGTIVPK